MPLSEDIIVMAIVVFFIARMAWRGIKGTRYSATSLFLRPILYMALSAFLILGLILWQDAVLALAAAAGVLLGLAFGKRANLFEKDGSIMYKRSNEVTILWMVAFAIRISIDFLFDPAINGSSTSITSIFAATSAFESSLPVYGADLLLAFSAGLLFGEALVLYRSYKSRYQKG